jgi:hypothetical protein
MRRGRRGWAGIGDPFTSHCVATDTCGCAECWGDARVLWQPKLCRVKALVAAGLVAVHTGLYQEYRALLAQVSYNVNPVWVATGGQECAALALCDPWQAGRPTEAIAAPPEVTLEAVVVMIKDWLDGPQARALHAVLARQVRREDGSCTFRRRTRGALCRGRLRLADGMGRGAVAR